MSFGLVRGERARSHSREEQLRHVALRPGRRLVPGMDAGEADGLPVVGLVGALEAQLYRGQLVSFDRI